MTDKATIDAFARATNLGYGWERDPENPGMERHVLYEHPTGIEWLRRPNIQVIDPALYQDPTPLS